MSVEMSDARGRRPYAGRLACRAHVRLVAVRQRQPFDLGMSSAREMSGAQTVQEFADVDACERPTVR